MAATSGFLPANVPGWAKNEVERELVFGVLEGLPLLPLLRPLTALLVVVVVHAGVVVVGVVDGTVGAGGST
jgi:hypothetical protein